MSEMKQGMRRLIAEKGQKANFTTNYRGEPELSMYGWTDYDAVEHCASYGDDCTWVVPEGVTVVEETISTFCGTFADNQDEVGVNAAGCHCACGRYKDVTLRVTCSLGEAIQSLIGYDTTKTMQL